MHLFQNDYDCTTDVTNRGIKVAAELIHCLLSHSRTAELAELVSFCVFAEAGVQ